MNFDNETVVTRPIPQLISILIIQRRSYAVEGMGAFKKLESAGNDPSISVVRGRVYELFLEVEAGMKDKLTPEGYEALKAAVDSYDYATLEQAFKIIDAYLYDIRLTKIDTKNVIDTTDWEAENKEHGL